MGKLILLALFDLWEGTNRGGGGPLDLKDLERLALNATKITLSLVSTVAVLYLVIGGFQYIMSSGNPDNVGKAKNTILYAIIGLLLAILSFAIVSFIISKF